MKRIDPPHLDTAAYRQLWRVVDGSVRSCFRSHPNYIPSSLHGRAIRNSIVKRVVGSVLSYAVETAKARSVGETAREKTGAVVTASARGETLTPRPALRERCAGSFREDALNG